MQAPTDPLLQRWPAMRSSQAWVLQAPGSAIAAPATSRVTGPPPPGRLWATASRCFRCRCERRAGPAAGRARPPGGVAHGVRGRPGARRRARAAAGRPRRRSRRSGPLDHLELRAPPLEAINPALRLLAEVPGGGENELAAAAFGEVVKVVDQAGEPERPLVHLRDHRGHVRGQRRGPVLRAHVGALRLALALVGVLEVHGLLDEPAGLARA